MGWAHSVRAPYNNPVDQRGRSSLLELPAEPRGFPVQSLYVWVGGASSDHLISNFKVTYLQPDQPTPPPSLWPPSFSNTKAILWAPPSPSMKTLWRWLPGGHGVCVFILGAEPQGFTLELSVRSEEGGLGDPPPGAPLLSSRLRAASGPPQQSASCCHGNSFREEEKLPSVVASCPCPQGLAWESR